MSWLQIVALFVLPAVSFALGLVVGAMHIGNGWLDRWVRIGGFWHKGCHYRIVAD